MGDVSITIPLSEEEYERLREVAQAEGRALEELGADAVRRLLPARLSAGRDAKVAESHPLLRLAEGLYDGGPPDGADNHDYYLYGLPKRR